MVKLSSKTLALVISAIKNMRQSKGSNSRDILNYISSIYEIPQDVAKRQMVAALKRGVAHGIVKKSEGYYSLPTDTEAECMEVAAQELGLLDLCCRKKKRERRKKKGCKMGSSSRRRKRKGCKKRRGRSRSKKRGKGCGCKGKSRRGRAGRHKRSRRGKSRCKPKIRPKKCNFDGEVLEEINSKSGYLNVEACDNDEGKFLDRRTSRCRTKSRSRSCSRNRNVAPTA